MTLWQLKFQKSNPSEWNMDEFNLAWNWIFQDGIESSVLRLGIIRSKSLQLRRQGVEKSAEMAACEVWRKCL
jgi:hypothetical protein